MTFVVKIGSRRTKNEKEIPNHPFNIAHHYYFCLRTYPRAHPVRSRCTRHGRRECLGCNHPDTGGDPDRHTNPNSTHAHDHIHAASYFYPISQPLCLLLLCQTLRQRIHVTNRRLSNPRRQGENKIRQQIRRQCNPLFWNDEGKFIKRMWYLLFLYTEGMMNQL